MKKEGRKDSWRKGELEEEVMLLKKKKEMEDRSKKCNGCSRFIYLIHNFPDLVETPKLGIVHESQKIKKKKY